MRRRPERRRGPWPRRTSSASPCTAAAAAACAPGNPNAKLDALPDEPGGYAGFQGLFGAKAVNPAITGGQPVVKDTEGQPIADPFGQPGLPGFDGMLAKVSLGYVAADAGGRRPGHLRLHLRRPRQPQPGLRASGSGRGRLPGPSCRPTTEAFGAFFDRLKAHGIDKRNTLFVFTVDENDHFAGGDSADGTWSHTSATSAAGSSARAQPAQPDPARSNANLAALPARRRAELPGALGLGCRRVLLNGNPPRTDAALRKLERDVAATKAIDPYVSPDPTPITSSWSTPSPSGRCTWSTPIPAHADLHAVPANPDYFLSTFNCPGRGRRWAGLHRLPLRLEPRRRDGRHRQDLARPGGTGRAQPGPDEPHLGRPHRRAPDDARAARA
jgi:hypothetical protein